MSRKDRERWDAKWQERTGETIEIHPILTDNQALLAGSGEALDLACGRGQNAIWLAQQGYQVVGVDISQVALAMARDTAKSSGLNKRLRFLRTDLDSLSLPAQAYDLIAVIRYLNRRLFPALETAVKPGGILVYATRHRGILDFLPDSNPDFLLEKDELLRTFGHWEILHTKEGRVEAEIIVRKPPLT